MYIFIQIAFVKLPTIVLSVPNIILTCNVKHSFDDIIRNKFDILVYIFLPRITEECVVNSGLLKQIILATLTIQFLIYNMQLCI